MSSELRKLDGAELREAVKPGGALERLIGKGKAGAMGGLWTVIGIWPPCIME